MHAQTPSRDALAPRSELFEHGPDIMRTKQIRRNSLFPPFFEHDLSFFFSAAKLTNPNSLIPPCDLYRSDQNFPFLRKTLIISRPIEGKRLILLTRAMMTGQRNPVPLPSGPTHVQVVVFLGSSLLAL
jgi:hypothetical protein